MENELSNGTRTVVDVLREVAARQPDAVAVRWRGGELRYAEFLRRVDGVAGMLQARGVGAGTFVGVYLSRSIEMLVALLGTLAAGACYVPMDPDMPAARLRHIVADSGTHIVLSDRPELADAAAGIAVVPPSAWPADGTVAVTPPGLAYMIYTSGSTGRPKGVPVEHAALSQYVAWCLRTLNFSGGGVPLFGSIAYDHVITSLFPPLSAGEHLRLLDNIEGGSSLAQALLGKHEDRIPRYSYLKITPSHVRMLNGCSASSSTTSAGMRRTWPCSTTMGRRKQRWAAAPTPFRRVRSARTCRSAIRCPASRSRCAMSRPERRCPRASRESSTSAETG